MARQPAEAKDGPRSVKLHIESRSSLIFQVDIFCQIFFKVDAFYWAFLCGIGLLPPPPWPEGTCC